MAQFSGAPHGPGMSWTRRWGRAQLSPKSRSRVGHAPPSGIWAPVPAHLAAYCSPVPGCRSVWYRLRCERRR